MKISQLSFVEKLEIILVNLHSLTGLAFMLELMFIISRGGFLPFQKKMRRRIMPKNTKSVSILLDEAYRYNNLEFSGKHG